MGDQMMSTGNNELVTMVGNIDALLNEIKQALGIGAQAQGQAEQITEKNQDADADDMNGDKDPNEMRKSKLKKAVVETQSDGVTANDSAEERQEEEATDTSEENMDKLAKAFMTLLGKQPVNKQKKAEPVAKIEKSLGDMVVLMKALVDEQNAQKTKQSEIETGLMNVLKGLKIADEIEKEVQAVETQKVQKGLTNSVDNERMELFIKSLVGASTEKQENGFTAQARNESVMKSLRKPEILKALIGNPRE